MTGKEKKNKNQFSYEINNKTGVSRSELLYSLQFFWCLCSFVDFWVKMNLAEICDNAKKGREYALLGNYDSSMVYYQGVIQQIQRHCQSIRDPAVKGKWQQVRWNRAPCPLLSDIWKIHSTYPNLCGTEDVYFNQVFNVFFTVFGCYLWGNISYGVLKRNHFVLIELFLLSLVMFHHYSLVCVWLLTLAKLFCWRLLFAVVFFIQ